LNEPFGINTRRKEEIMIGRWSVVGLAGLFLVGAAAGQEMELQALAGKAGAWKSYAFTIDQKPGPGKPVEGKHQAGQPTWFKADGIEFYRKGTALVYLDGGRWQRSRTGTLSDPLHILGPASRIRRVTALPNEELPGLVKDLTDVKKADGKEKGSTVYTGKLTAAGLKEWAPTESRSVAREGTIWVESVGGKVVRYSVSFRLKGRRGDAEVDGKLTRTVQLRGAGSTRVEVPAAARKALE
jgi:hypothetical protein